MEGERQRTANVVERAIILAVGDSINLDSLPYDIRMATAKTPIFIEADEMLSLKKASKELEKSFISKALNRTGGNRSQAAALLEISYPSLLQKIKEYGIS